MDRRIDSDEALPWLREGELHQLPYWIPPTLVNHVSESSYPRNQDSGGLAEWELPQFPPAYEQQDVFNLTGVTQFGAVDQLGGSFAYNCINDGNWALGQSMANGTANVYPQALYNQNVGWNDCYQSLNEKTGWDSFTLAELQARMNTTSVPMTNQNPDLYTRTIGEPSLVTGFQANSWRGVNLDKSSHEQAQSISSDLFCDNFSFPAAESDGFHIPYDLNVHPTMEGDTTFNIATCCPLISATPAPAKELASSNIASISNVRAEKTSNWKNDKHKEFVTLLEYEREQRNCGDLLHDILGSTTLVSAAVVQPNGHEKGIDLNKTPQKQTQKRKKHRPKVIIDDKAHNTPKVATMKPKDVKEKSIGKGKNVQREGLQDSSEQKEEVSAAANTELIIDAKGKGRYVQLLESDSSGDISKAGTAEKSCRRALAFGSEITIDNKQSNADSQLETRKRKIEGLNLNVRLQASEISGEAHKISVLESSNTATYSISTSTNQISNNLAAGCQLPSAMYEQRGDLYMSRRYTGMSMPQQFHLGTEQLLCSNTRQSEQNSSFLLAEGRGLKRQHDRIEQLTPRTRTVKPSVLHQSVIQDDYYQRCGGNSRTSTCLSENHKKKKIEGIQYGALSCNAETRGPQQEANRMNAADPFQYTSRRILELLAFFSRNHPSKRSCDFQTHLMNSTRHLPNHRSSEPDLSKEKIGERNRSTTGNLETLPSTPLKSHQRSQPMFRNVTSPSSYVSSENTRLSEKQNSRKEKRQRSTKGRDKLKVMETDRSLSFQSHAAQKTTQELLEEIFDLMERLNLNCGLREGEQNALVPYKEDRAIVPYSDSEFIKRLKPRPKVDLDRETERVWKLLMWKEGSDDIEGTDKEKEKWWEEERGVFRGRAESFIARMRLVQGDRRFSKWKGSVVDSVIGVFLTQNVSDHLSSSAFMSLAALFPPNSMRNRTPTGDSTSMPLNELGINTQNCNNIRWHEKHKTFYDRSSSKLHESSEFVSHCEPSLRDTNNRAAHSHYLAEQVLPSQESISSSFGESNHAFRSYSASNPEAEDPTYAYKASKCQGSYFSDLHRQRMRMEDLTYLKGSSIFHQHINQKDPQISIPVIPSRNQLMHNTEQTKVQEVASREFHDEESIPTSLATAILLGKINGTSWTSLRTSPGIDTVNNSASKHHVLAMPQGILPSQSDISAKQTWSELSTLHASHSAQLYERNNGFLSKITSVTQPSILAGQVDITLNSSRSHSSPVPKLVGKPFDVEERVDLAYNQKDAAIKLVMSSSGKQQVSKETKANTIKEGKRNTSKKKEAVDWDSLRKSVEANGKSERSQDTMDSMDYDAMRHTSVNKISEAIKERGMNNMLAERIKEFLDRLVRDHGSTDLEWLRHVPPEKAKEYLLSIRGLGLKSVECVRLLTLHHLAFPVDTNVGRIAVRLGWVPLQPLPESLQIHLLERYPVLESVQKYLWPRLCKLDQQTLYELHYQMITFGKVFCTKSKPNCNACPLRAECRHFASAFASARLALPCPEEKTTVTSITPLNDTNLGVVIDPMPLPSPRDNSLARVEIGISSCVPIVEEPVTPEIENVDVSLSDIEDAFSEDPDEIPTINLNMKEFSAHLQEYMNENMELQDDDMSKALVALNQQAISIPTTKLKNVSRLRTEHQVYEIPDGHPLLEGMDKREPDDPSPYLLAIWSPGETANSVELPEKQCQSQEADECCDNATCFACNGRREAITQTVRGTLLIPCRTAMRGSFPLNGTYFQVNEVFADHKSSLEPIDVPRQWIWNLPRRIVYFGTSVSAIFRGLSTEKIQYCFWKGFVCVRGFDQKYRAPRPLQKRLHLSASKLAKTKSERT